MKVNGFLLIIAIIISGLIFYGFWAGTHSWLYSCIAGATSLATLIPSFCLTIEDSPRSGIMIKAASSAFFGLFIVMNILFAVFSASTPWVVISNGILVALWLTAIYGMARSKQ